jgi:hypothetical protein
MMTYSTTTLDLCHRSYLNLSKTNRSTSSLERRHTILIVAIIFLGFVNNLSAQEPKPKSSRPVATKNIANQANREISVTETFAPTFSIEPLSHRLSGRENEVLPFAFKIEARNKDADLEVAAIGLRQELSGQIFYDEVSGKADLIQLLTPPKFTAKANVASTIEGVVKIPKGTGKFHSVGIMVKDIGKGPELPTRTNPDGTPATSAGVRFVTQYLLRLDLVSESARGDSGSKLTVESVKMVAFEGRPRLQSIIANPTGSPFEFEVRARIRKSPSDRSSKPLRLVMPARASIQDESRYNSRILSQSRIRMEELLPEAIAGGRYYVDFELSVDGQIVHRKTETIEVNSADFPAQEVLIAQVGDSLQVSPSQLELSQLRGGTRRTTIQLTNSGQDTKTIHLKAMASDGLANSWVIMQPSEVQLAPGANRKVSLTLRSQPSGDNPAEYGSIQVESKSDKQDFTASQSLPLAILLKKLEPTKITLSPIVWDPVAEYPGFNTTVQNLGTTHLPLQARLTIFDSKGRPTVIPSGFGKWLMPGKSSKLEFRLEGTLPPDEYVLRCELQQDGEPIRMEQNFTVTDLENAVSAKKK